MVNEKPHDWPLNERERRIQAIYEATNSFIKDPSLSNKMKLSSLVTPTDNNEFKNTGIARILDYEVKIINTLYVIAALRNLFNLRFYLLWHVYSTILSMRMLQYMFPWTDNLELFKPYNHLVPELHIFFVIYYNYRGEKKRDFIDVVSDEVNRVINRTPTEEILMDLEEGIISMVHTISHLPDKRIFPVLAFSREEIKKLFSICSTLLKKSGHNITQRPYKGTLSIAITNLITNSRNNYNCDAIYKYMDRSIIESVIESEEIWMHKTSSLNDKREGSLIHEIMKDKTWIPYDWAKSIVFDNDCDTYVSSFSKSGITKSLEAKYGSSFFGYKNDRVSDLLAPVFRSDDGYVYMGYVRHYDVIYGHKEAKEELNFLFDIIEILGNTDEEKNVFLNHVILYWVLSFKDMKWSDEKERRYEIVILCKEDCYDMRIENDYLKLKSPIFLSPDFVSSDIPKKKELRDYIVSRNQHQFLLCEECLNRDYDDTGHQLVRCSRCGSKNVTWIMNVSST